LAKVRRLKAAAVGSPEERHAQGDEFIHFFDSETITHFREEEEVVFPLVIGESEAEPVLARSMMEHLAIHALVHELRAQLSVGDPTPESLSAIAVSLEAHIRYEEKTLFPLIERLVFSELADVTLAPRDRVDAAPVAG
jgi:iron-sulfur cluster repair protein YtfE (RIC family)